MLLLIIHDGSNNNGGHTNFTKDPRQQKRTPPAKEETNYFLRVIPALKHSDRVSDIPAGRMYGKLILTFFLHLSGIHFDILSDIVSDILSDILSGIYWHAF